MQIMPAAAIDIGRAHGRVIDRADLTRPSTNIEVGQSYLEQLRDQACTGGLLPKVIAAYNAGPVPVSAWNASTRDNGDPLLYIESIPYWETRGYVTTVLRNYWIYEGETGKKGSPSRAALAQGMWPRRSEEHTSELQSLMRISYAVFCLKKKKQIQKKQTEYDRSQHN